ncbi:CTP synthase [Streptomyces viridosporus]
MSVSAQPRLALVGDRGNHDEPSHPKIDAMREQWDLTTEWIPTTEIHDASRLDGFDGIWVVPGAPYFNQKGVHIAVRHARENQLPFLGTCGGFFSALIEHAQNVLHLPEAAGVDEDPEKLMPLVTPLKCSFRGETAPLKVKEDSRLAAIYGTTEVEEIFHCDYGLTDTFMNAANQGSLQLSAWDSDGAPRALEIIGHPFFMGSLFQPELSSAPGAEHKILRAFLAAVRTKADASALPTPTP